MSRMFLSRTTFTGAFIGIAPLIACIILNVLFLFGALMWGSTHFSSRK
jgi:hypothetical protein